MNPKDARRTHLRDPARHHQRLARLPVRVLLRARDQGHRLVFIVEKTHTRELGLGRLTSSQPQPRREPRRTSAALKLPMVKAEPDTWTTWPGSVSALTRRCTIEYCDDMVSAPGWGPAAGSKHPWLQASCFRCLWWVASRRLRLTWRGRSNPGLCQEARIEKKGSGNERGYAGGG